MTPSPYAKDLGSREPIAAMRDTISRIQTLTGDWTTPHFDRSYAPGKWSARLLLTHLAQAELALGNRARMALTIPNYMRAGLRSGQMGGRVNRTWRAPTPWRRSPRSRT